MQDTFVARMLELRQLDHFLDKAVRGQGQICFITGEAGAGKSALAAAFAQRAQEKHPTLIVATGVCDAQTGVGDPYLPIREVLGQLTGDVDSRLTQGVASTENAKRLKDFLVVSSEILLKHGPDLIGLFLPAAALLAKLGQTVAEKADLTRKLRQRLEGQRETRTLSQTGIDQTQIFEQCVNVLRELAKHHPLLLLLDDLHWADAASIGLLFHLGRRLEGSRILLVGAYRPEEVALGRAGERHPLDKVLAEFKRYFGDIWIDLDQTIALRGREFVDVLLDSEPNRLDESFRCALLAHTAGHPLFTVELLREMQEQGELVKAKDGYWVQRSQLDWSVLPARVEGVIEERLARLAAELRQSLTVASIEGEQFTAEVIASIRSLEARRLVQQLSGELEKEHRLVASLDVQRLGGQRLSRYRFAHSLVQSYLYARLDAVELAYLHEDVGRALETLYGEQADEIAPQLARHFELADMAAKARYYLRRAGEQAATAFANIEALNYLSRALALTPITELTDRYDLLLVREQVYALIGSRDAQAQDLATLEALAEELSDSARRAVVALRRAAYAEATNDYPAAVARAQQAVAFAQSAGAVESEARGYWAWGSALWYQADYTTASTQYEHALALARQAGLHQIEADALRGLGIICIDQGEYATARIHLGQSLALCRQLEDRRGESNTLNSLAVVAFYQNDYVAARALFEQSLRLNREIGNRRGEGMVLGNLGVFAYSQGDFMAANAYSEQSLLLYRQMGDRSGVSGALVTLGRSALDLGDPILAQDYFEQAFTLAREISAQEWIREALAGLGTVALHLGDTVTAQMQYQQALSLARKLGDRRHEGKFLGNLGQVSYLSGNGQAAHDLNHQADAFVYSGHGLLDQGKLDEATAAYQRALEVRRQLGQSNQAIECLASLAHVALRCGDTTLANAHAEEILAYLKTNTLSALGEPFVYLTIYQVLQAKSDARAHDLLEQAYTRLQARAAKIPDERLQNSFVENVPSHRALVSAWKKYNMD
jgi:predicted ATPase